MHILYMRLCARMFPEEGVQTLQVGRSEKNTLLHEERMYLTVLGLLIDQNVSEYDPLSYIIEYDPLSYIIEIDPERIDGSRIKGIEKRPDLFSENISGILLK